MNEEIDVFEGRGGEGGPLSLIFISIIIGEYMKTFCFKFHQSRAINEKFYVWGEGKILPRGPKEGRVARFQKIEKSLYKTVLSTHSQNFSILAELEKT